MVARLAATVALHGDQNRAKERVRHATVLTNGYKANMTDRATTIDAPEAEEQDPTELPAPAKRRGHWPKIDQAVQALRRAGQLPPNLRPVVRDRRVIDWLKANGYGNDLPSPSALARYFRKSD